MILDYAFGDAEGEGDGEASEPEPLPLLFFEEDFLPDEEEELFFMLVSLCSEWPDMPFLEDISELLDMVVDAVSVLDAQEVKNATPRRTTIDETNDFFMGLVTNERRLFNSRWHCKPFVR